ncbi:hypothetical protein [Pedococcus sp. 5OH_020]|uniref:hypothetical protein n=1 Tax=Pedococcus sp. 5OH_020 TaxID=2989814 RepID=UPI0022E9AD6F|nr:hypothetical protein [Pedococcus sp. 5OH_020]
MTAQRRRLLISCFVVAGLLLGAGPAAARITQALPGTGVSREAVGTHADAQEMSPASSPRQRDSATPQTSAGGVGSTPVGASRFVPGAPTRAMDTRTGFRTTQGAIGSGQTRVLQVTGFAGVPAGARAVVMNLTATQASAAGYLTVWPAGTARPGVSNLNIQRAGQTIPNAATVQLPASGEVAIYAQHRTHVVIDILGYYQAATNVASGRFRTVWPARLLDTRTGGAAQVPAGGTVEIRVLGRGGVPSAHVGSVVLNVTYTQALAAGFVTAYAAGTPRPGTSNLNVPGAGSTAANFVVAALGANGAVTLYTSAPTHLLVDVGGYYTNDTATPGGDGLFVPVRPARAIDSRACCLPLDPGEQWIRQVSGKAGVPATGAFAVLLNLTGTQAVAPGYLRVFPLTTTGPPPATSTLNLEHAGDTRANLAVAQLGQTTFQGAQTGWLTFQSQRGAHVIADVAGWFTVAGPCTTATTATPSGLPAGSSQVRLIHVRLSGQTRSAAVTAGICAEWPFVQRWFEGQAGGLSPRVKRVGGQPEVTLADLPVTAAQLMSGDDGQNLRDQLTAFGFRDPAEVLVAFVDVDSGYACGATWRSLNLVALYMATCTIYPAASTMEFPYGGTYVVAHETTHALGAAPPCAPHADSGGHVSDSNADIIYNGPSARNWDHLVLDYRHDDYYHAGIAGCPDIASHPAWSP